MMTYDSLAPFIKRLLGAPNEATARRIMGAIGIGASSDSIIEGATNLFFTPERAMDAVAAMIAAGAPHTGITITYNDALDKMTFVVMGGGGSGIVRAVASIAVNTAAGAVALTDYVYTATVAGVTLTLPTAVGNSNVYTYKNGSAGNVNLAATGAETFDGTASPIVLIPNQSLDLISDGANWRIT